MDTLEKIFGGSNKVKIMRLFLFNPQTSFDLKDISQKTKTSLDRARIEIKNLEKVNLIKKRSFLKEIPIKNTRSKETNKVKKKRTNGWILDEKFPFLLPLQNFLINITSSQHREIMKKLKKVGSIKLLILSGVFIQEWDSRVDILIVGDRMKRGIIENVISEIESEVGKDLKYTFFETQDFLYRIGVCDKLVRDILDYPHKKLINRLELI